jgi:hypothetical protein
MAVITAATTAERLAPTGERVARAIGAVAAGTAGLFLIARAAGLAKASRKPVAMSTAPRIVAAPNQKSR